MKKLLLALLALAAICLSGCIVLSVCPFYTEKDLVFDPALLGSWKNTEKTNTLWQFETEVTNLYRLSIKNDNEVNLTHARLFKLNGKLFIDMLTPKAEVKEGNQTMFPPPIPSHTILRVAQLAPTLRVAFMNYDWLAEFLEKNPAALRHYVMKEEGDNKKPFYILTADTADLQKFVLKHYANTNAWGEYTELKREPAKPKE